MRTIIFVLLITLALESLNMNADAMTPSETAVEIIKTENAFAQMANDAGMVDAFLKYLHDDAVVFRPKPLNGKRWYSSRPATTARLKWWPTYVEAASAGDLGLSTGPYEFRSDDSDTVPVYHGHFVSIWQRQPDGKFLVMADLGNSHDKPDSVLTAVTIGNPSKQGDTVSSTHSEGTEGTLAQAESTLTALTSSEGSAAGFAKYYHDDVRVYRDGSEPYVGKKLAQAAFGDTTELTSFQNTFSALSKNNDFGYTYGITRHWQRGKSSATAKSSSDLRVWRRTAEGEWMIVLEIALPIEK